MRIIQFGPYPPPHGGVQSNIAALHQYLSELGIDARVVNMGYSDYHGERPETPRVRYPGTRLELLWRALTSRADIIHVHVGGGLRSSLLLFLLLCTLVPRRRTVLSFHSGGYPTSPEGLSARPSTLRGFIFRRFDHIIAVNEQIGSMFTAFGVQPARISVIPPGAVLPSQTAGEKEQPGALSSFAARHSPLLVTIGLLEPEYDLERQVELLERIADEFPGAGLAVIGSGSLHEVLRRRIEASPFADRILLAGDVPHAATIRLLARADLFLRTTLYDGDAVSVREALALSVPVVATDNGMRPPGVQLCRTADTESLYETVVSLLRGAATTGTAAPTGVDTGLEGLRRVVAVYCEMSERGHAWADRTPRPGETDAAA